MDERVSWGRVLAAVTCAATVSMLPVFLLGAAAPSLGADLHVDAGRLGIAVSAFWIAMALVGLVGGHVAHARGSRATTIAGIAIAVVSLVGLATAGSFAALVVFAVVGGAATALATPAGDMALFSVLPPERRGFAYGVKQASLPGASLLAGLGVPLVVLTVGWRWAFAAAVLVALPALIALPRRLPRPAVRSAAEPAARRAARPRGLVPVSTAVALAMAAVSATGGFYVVAAVAGGTAAPTAGFLLALGGVCGISGRFVASWRFGTAARPLLVCAGLMAAGGLGTAGLALTGSTGGLAAATVLACGAGWGWNGLLTQDVVASHPEATARASAAIMVGAAVGGVAGPALFGLVATGAGYTVAWLAAGGCLLLAAAVLVVREARRAPAPVSGATGHHR
ncbi:major facilitator superfamily MFS_1 [Pseudonocardia dioxanivorans CB1190]|uniref:Major facilitator superfamily MFS_1 n=1 Tax=Pseudonocardia dioxanivorans (strain ATCC 55486 / DSM 44775 / JCM 13855 / CB1190) TaxID=675635 RepID=F4CTA2_PSEUX|nr:MFS transporter [Pseudonocardia dioxanivorans]AEA26320.1 major facilitator superfamily MFS_1 [Pseudonocardia dioxanivorans CB1190]